MLCVRWEMGLKFKVKVMVKQFLKMTEKESKPRSRVGGSPQESLLKKNFEHIVSPISHSVIGAQNVLQDEPRIGHIGKGRRSRSKCRRCAWTTAS